MAAMNPVEFYLAKIPGSYRERKIDNDHMLSSIAGKIPDWEALAGYLSNVTEDIKAIKRDNLSYDNQKTALLRKWLDKNGDRATYSELVKGMYSAGQINAIDELVKVLQREGVRSSEVTLTDPEEQSIGVVPKTSTIDTGPVVMVGIPVNIFKNTIAAPIVIGNKYDIPAQSRVPNGSVNHNSTIIDFEDDSIPSLKTDSHPHNQGYSLTFPDDNVDTIGPAHSESHLGTASGNEEAHSNHGRTSGKSLPPSTEHSRNNTAGVPADQGYLSRMIDESEHNPLIAEEGAHHSPPVCHSSNASRPHVETNKDNKNSVFWGLNTQNRSSSVGMRKRSLSHKANQTSNDSNEHVYSPTSEPCPLPLDSEVICLIIGTCIGICVSIAVLVVTCVIVVCVLCFGIFIGALLGR